MPASAGHCLRHGALAVNRTDTIPDLMMLRSPRRLAEQGCSVGLSDIADNLTSGRSAYVEAQGGKKVGKKERLLDRTGCEG